MSVRHSVLTDPEIHEPKGIASAAARRVYVSNGAGSGTWTELLGTDGTLVIEPKGVGTAERGQVLVCSGTGTAIWEFPYTYIPFEIADIGAVGSAFVVMPFDGILYKILITVDGALAGANTILTSKIGGSAVTGGAVTLAYSGSGGGSVFSATPSAANTFSEGQVIELASDGGATNSVRARGILVVQQLAVALGAP